jgi:hypothetical protein
MLTKVCTKCGVEKDIDNYQNRKGGKYGVRADCKVCNSRQRSQYRENNKEAVNSQKKVYYQANRETILERQKSYRQANKEILAERVKTRRQDNIDAHREAAAKRNRAYKKAHRHLANADSAKRRAIKLQATPSWADKEHIESLYLIAAINREAGYDLHVDHIVPLRSGLVCGLHCEANLQLLPASVNISKNNRYWPDQW